MPFRSVAGSEEETHSLLVVALPLRNLLLRSLMHQRRYLLAHEEPVQPVGCCVGSEEKGVEGWWGGEGEERGGERVEEKVGSEEVG